MTTYFIININQHDALPSIAELTELLNEHKYIQVKYTTLPTAYIATLTYSFSNFDIRHRQWDKSISVSPSISNEAILNKKQELYNCAVAFRKDANNLMGLMSLTFNIDLNTLDGLHDLKRKSHKQKGRLNEEWNYHLHGAECCFENNQAGQIVEIIVINKPEFGFLDAYFFYNYMASTQRFEPLAVYFSNNYNYIYKAIDLLAIEGVLTRLTTAYDGRNIIAL